MAIESIAIVGPTASGKTRRAVDVARSLNGEIISADSRQVYKDMSLGTGKDLEDYQEINYHLIDVCEAGEKYNLHRYLTDFRVAYEDILSRGCLPVICGGSGMYVENALNGIRMPEVPVNEELREELKNYSLEELTHILSKYKTLHNTTDVDNVKRAIRAIEIGEYCRQHPEEASHISKDNAQPLNSLVVGLDIPREERRRSISLRLKTRLDNGMLQEVKNLLERGIHPEDLIYYGLEYKYLTLHLIGELSFEDMFQQLEIAIHQFAKRQMTWFRGMEKRGIKIHWLPYDLPEDDFIEKVQELIFSQD